ncbi:3',5'-cyclic-nucleotide phosphodiesterase [Cryobacterium roopkundense]|uniref:3',5'-cyclic AMP phosphodiesterase CpdA n=1 Tax=Cryobacterium roopkundense TaxID=1001240 RepID=A0A099J4M9_9MICO|nr:phosphodiesterase [Cryobacterium roopkundense]KGJ73364.1 3',5'-cyclic-nucleotide phosphodiesterase [Cryobacterium roopkundense]MBB5641585.1 3',5'-cyclic AMP phosphodiesterase CpdA [Cryobacterium roopkundense]
MSAVQLGQHAPATHLIVHLSDTHFLGDRALLYGTIDTDSTVYRALAQLDRSGLRPDALVITGDVADRGEDQAYRRVRDIVESAAAAWGAHVIWVMGNHDKREPFRTELLREPTSATSDEPIDRVTMVNGLRIIAIDTSVPGYHHGELSPAQLDWLARELREPAPNGTVLALHHPPVPTPLALMSVLELREQSRLADVVRGSDIRGILGGHLHYSTHGLFAGIPVSVAAATCYTMDLSAPERELTGVDGGQSLALVHVYADQVVHSAVPIGDFAAATHFPAAYLDVIEGLPPEERAEKFSRHSS